MISVNLKGTGQALAGSLLAAALGGLTACSSEPEQLAVENSAKAAKLSQCVEPTDFMRRNHMEVIKHQRDETVHKGIRDTNHSLAGCVDCHVQYDAQQQPVPIDAPGQFCAACHEFTAVKLDCFQCHATIPAEASWSAASITAHGFHGKVAEQEKGTEQ